MYFRYDLHFLCTAIPVYLISLHNIRNAAPREIVSDGTLFIVALLNTHVTTSGGFNDSFP